MPTRRVGWFKDDSRGAEFVDVVLGAGHLRATGVAVGSKPMAYRLDYVLETHSGYITSRIRVRTRGQGWKRVLDLRRSAEGIWTEATLTHGEAPLPACGGDMAPLVGALDCDLGLSPLTNSMPVLRHALMTDHTPMDFRMAWISVPDLGVHLSRQRYSFLRDEAERHVILYESTDSGFSAELIFDDDGLVVDYPGIGRRMG